MSKILPMKICNLLLPVVPWHEKPCIRIPTFLQVGAEHTYVLLNPVCIGCMQTAWRTDQGLGYRELAILTICPRMSEIQDLGLCRSLV
jgi:hypothetical protein